MASVLTRLGTVTLCLLGMVGCDEHKSVTPQESLTLPQRLNEPYVSDQTTIGGKHFVLFDDGGGCRLQVQKQEAKWLKPTAPCFFIKSPGSDRVQVYQHDKTTQIVAVLGTPAKGNRCGQEVQGIVIKGNEIRLSTYVSQGSVYCADSGLYNFQYNLFAK